MSDKPSRPGDAGRTCASCRFSGIAVHPVTGQMNFQARVCKWGPPTMLVLPAPNGVQIRPMWPAMDLKDFCHRQEPRPASEGIEVAAVASQESAGVSEGSRAN